MVNALNIKYEPSDSIVAQGKNVRKQEKNGFYKKYGGNGSYRMVKPSKVTLEFEVDGQRHSSPVRQLICDAYSISRVSEATALRFFSDLKLGHIQLEYSDEKGLSLM